jgi:Cyclic nucleotide-binding domain.
MAHPFITHVQKIIQVSTLNEVQVLSYFEEQQCPKKDILLPSNTRCKYHYFVIEGCLRMFFINEKGIEQTVQFAIENWWLTDYMAFAEKTTSEFSIQAVEPTTVLQITTQQQENLLTQFPMLERYFRIVYQKAYAASLYRLKYLFDFSREELFVHFSRNFPEFVKRVPQHLLASFLNMTPEYLSEIKKHLQS